MEILLLALPLDRAGVRADRDGEQQGPVQALRVVGGLTGWLGFIIAAIMIAAGGDRKSAPA